MIRFTKAEINLLFYLIETEKESGYYYGVEKHYKARLDSVKNKLKQLENKNEKA